MAAARHRLRSENSMVQSRPTRRRSKKKTAGIYPKKNTLEKAGTLLYSRKGHSPRAKIIVKEPKRFEA